MKVHVREVWFMDMKYHGDVEIDLEEGERVLQIDCYSDPQGDRQNVRVWIARNG